MDTLLQLLGLVLLTGLVVAAAGIWLALHTVRRLGRALAGRLRRPAAGPGAWPPLLPDGLGTAMPALVLRATGAVLGWAADRRTGRGAVVWGRGADRRPGRAQVAGLRLRGLVPGPQQELAALRSGLRRDVSGTVAAVGSAARGGRPLPQLVGLARQVQEHARALDVDLAVLAAEPDTAVRQHLLQRQAGRIAELRAACAQLREGVLVAGTLHGSLPGLHAELAEELAGLRLQAQAYDELSRR